MQPRQQHQRASDIAEADGIRIFASIDHLGLPVFKAEARPRWDQGDLTGPWETICSARMVERLSAILPESLNGDDLGRFESLIEDGTIVYDIPEGRDAADMMSAANASLSLDVAPGWPGSWRGQGDITWAQWVAANAMRAGQSIDRVIAQLKDIRSAQDIRIAGLKAVRALEQLKGHTCDFCGQVRVDQCQGRRHAAATSESDSASPRTLRAVELACIAAGAASGLMPDWYEPSARKPTAKPELQSERVDDWLTVLRVKADGGLRCAASTAFWNIANEQVLWECLQFIVNFGSGEDRRAAISEIAQIRSGSLARE